jgi:hypothetical protein
MKVVAITFAWGKYRTWDMLYKNCTESFKKWHPDIELRIIGDESYDGDVSTLDGHTSSIWRFKECRKLFDEGYTKVIMLGLDTFTCARWDEFLNDDTTSVLTTLSGPYMFGVEGVNMQYVLYQKHGWYENKYIGADLVCYNSSEAVDKLIEIQEKYKIHDQHAINYYINEVEPKCNPVDYPYIFSTFVYQGLASWPGQLAQTDCVLPDGSLRFGHDGKIIGAFSPTTCYKPIGDKLYNHIGKHIKAFNFDKSFNRHNIYTYMNNETINWLKTYSNINLRIKE